MSKQTLIQKIILQIQILRIQIKILLYKQKLTVPNLPGPKYIIVHHEGGNNGFLSVNEWHRQKWGWKSSLGRYCGYQRYLDKNLVWWQARSDREEGAHCPGGNKDSIGLCLMGDYSKERASKEMIEKLRDMVDYLRIIYNIPRDHILSDFEARIPSRPTICNCSLHEDFVLKYRNKEL